MTGTQASYFVLLFLKLDTLILTQNIASIVVHDRLRTSEKLGFVSNRASSSKSYVALSSQLLSEAVKRTEFSISSTASLPRGIYPLVVHSLSDSYCPMNKKWNEKRKGCYVRYRSLNEEVILKCIPWAQNHLCIPALFIVCGCISEAIWTQQWKSHQYKILYFYAELGSNKMLQQPLDSGWPARFTPRGVSTIFRMSRVSTFIFPL